MKRMLMSLAVLMLLAGCSGEDLKKQVEQKNQLLAAQETEIKKIKDDMAAREADLKNQYEHDCLFISAANKEGIEQLREMIVTMVKREYQIRYPHEVRNW